MKIRKVATVAFYDDKKRILLQGRQKMSKFGEEWGFFGGSLEEGETPEQAAIREIKEELEYDVKELTLLRHYESQVTPEIYGHEHVFVAPFPGMDKLTQHEGTGMRLFSIPEARKLTLLKVYQKMLDDLETFLNL